MRTVRDGHLETIRPRVRRMAGAAKGPMEAASRGSPRLVRACLWGIMCNVSAVATPPPPEAGARLTRWRVAARRLAHAWRTWTSLALGA